MSGVTESILPFQSHFAEIAGMKMHYLDEGSGPVVILVHGNPTWCFFYRRLIEALKGSFRVIAIDHIGCGLSERVPGRRFRARDRIAHLWELIEQLGLTRYSIVMHDWGGPIATSVAIRAPQKVEKLVYLNTTLTEIEALPPLIRMAASPVIGRALTQHTMRFLKFMTNLGSAKKLSKEICEGYYAPYRTFEDRAAIWDFVEDIPFSSSHPTYPEMMYLASGMPKLQHVPVQIIWGLKDPCFHREMLPKVARHFPQARVKELADASHLVLEDAPEIVCDTIKSFLLEDVKVESRDNSISKDLASDSTRHALFAGFAEQANKIPYHHAVVTSKPSKRSVAYEHISYKELFDRVSRYQRGLTHLGLQTGDRVLMLVPPGTEFLALAYGVMAAGAVPVFIDPGIPKEFLFECIEDINPQAFIGSPKAHLLRAIRPRVFRGLKFCVTASDFSIGTGPNLSFLKRFSPTPRPEVPCDEVALIAFTSGATGKPKGVVYTQQMIRAQLEIFRETFGFEAGRLDLPLLPIFSLFNLALGVGSVFPPMNPAKPLDLNPELICRIANDLGVRFSFGSPTLWKKIADYCLRTDVRLSTLDRVFLAGAPVSEKLLKDLAIVLGQGKAYTPYGATEALPVTFPAGEEILKTDLKAASSGEQGTLVGKACPGVEIKVISARDDAITEIGEVEELAPLEIGEIIVRGQNISQQYLHRPLATKESKIPDAGSVWHRMGDMGYLDDSGNLYFCGRKAHAVKNGARTYFSVPVERVFNQHPSVHRSALVDSGANQPAIVVEPLASEWPRDVASEQKFRKELLALGHSSPLTEKIETVLFHRSFPVDNRHNAKIYRDRLSNWARGQKR